MLNKKHILSIAMLSAISLTTFATGMTQTWVSTETLTGTQTVQETAPVITSLSSTTIDGVDFVDAQTLIVKLSNLSSGVSEQSEVKALEDVKVLSAVKDATNAKKITLTLDADLVDNENYSIISVSEGLDTSIDFNLSWDKSKIVNPDLAWAETAVEYVSVTSPKTVDVYLNKETTLQSFEFKMFKEISSDNVFADVNNLNVKLKAPLVSNKDYILILNLKDSSGNDIEVENSLYDFATPEFAMPEVVPTMTETPEMFVESQSWETISPETATPIENVASEVTQTPDTWAKTNILLFLTFILTLSILLLRKKSLKM